MYSIYLLLNRAQQPFSYYNISSWPQRLLIAGTSCFLLRQTSCFLLSMRQVSRVEVKDYYKRNITMPESSVLQTCWTTEKGLRSQRQVSLLQTCCKILQEVNCQQLIMHLISALFFLFLLVILHSCIWFSSNCIISKVILLLIKTLHLYFNNYVVPLHPTSFLGKIAKWLLTLQWWCVFFSSIFAVNVYACGRDHFLSFGLFCWATLLAKGECWVWNQCI